MKTNDIQVVEQQVALAADILQGLVDLSVAGKVKLQEPLLKKLYRAANAAGELHLTLLRSHKELPNKQGEQIFEALSVE